MIKNEDKGLESSIMTKEFIRQNQLEITIRKES